MDSAAFGITVNINLAPTVANENAPTLISTSETFAVASAESALGKTQTDEKTTQGEKGPSSSAPTTNNDTAAVNTKQTKASKKDTNKCGCWLTIGTKTQLVATMRCSTLLPLMTAKA
jgi:hypothetical protein